MRKSQKLLLEQSELRESVNGLLGIEAGKLSTEQRGELDTKTKRLQETEGELRAAMIVESAEDDKLATLEGDDAEMVEIRTIRDRSRVGSYVAAAMQGRNVDGAESELNAALKMRPNDFPMRLLAPEPVRNAELETREATAANAQANQQRWLDRLFADTAAMKIGITFDSAGPGRAAYPVTTAGATAAARGKSETAVDAPWTVGVTTLDPKRNSVRALFNKEDDARLPGIEDALIRDLRMAMAEAVDRSIFIGDSGATPNAGDITGLQTTADIVEKTITQNNKVKGPETLAEFAALIDGKHATTPAELQTVAAVGANTLWMSTVVNSAADNQTLAQFLMASGINWSVGGGIETNTTNNKFGAFIGRGRGLVGAAVAPVWDAGELIRDPYSGAADGEVALTLCYLWNFGVPRPTNLARIKFVSN